MCAPEFQGGVFIQLVAKPLSFNVAIEFGHHRPYDDGIDVNIPI